MTLSVHSLEKSFDFYKQTLGFKPIMRSNKSAYFLAGDLWFCIEEDPETRQGPLPEYTHIAFTISKNDYKEIAEKIRKSEVKIFKENVSEGESLYFLDPNGHKLDSHVGDWKTRLKQYQGREDIEIFPVEY
jgi:catechol-2,3-dioxygenase